MFTHLHNHTEYSLLDGLSHPRRLVQRAAELGQKAIAITDHGNLYGAIDFYLAARAVGVKPIIGVEAYVAPGARFDRAAGDRFPYHMTLLARDETGYRNLIRLVSAAHLEGYYYRPRVDRALLEKHCAGITVLSGCPSGEVPKHLSAGRTDDARAAAAWYREVFGENYFFELMSHEGVDELPRINRGLVALGREMSIPLVATNDSHYTFEEDHVLQDILLCIQTNSTVNDRNRMRFAGPSFYVKSEEEMAALWPETPEAIANTQRIAESCDLNIEFGRSRLPRYPTPDGEPALEYLRKLCEEGLRRRFSEPTAEIKQRLKYELDVIEKTGFADYFLVAWDIGRFVHRRGIIMGVRGSAAASLVLYCLEVTSINPLETRLVFERFLNLERREMPDIDFDFQDDRREEVIHYVLERYGEGHVAQIITFGTLGPKAAVRDVGRALGMDFADVDAVARQIPQRLGITLDEALEQNGELARLARSSEAHRKLIEYARGLEGTVRHASTHAAGVLISEEPLTNIVPLQRPTGGHGGATPTTQYAMGPVARLGLLKMDFLGLTNLTIIDRALKMLRRRRGLDLSPGTIPLNDARTFELLGSGDTFGVFQLESEGMRRYVRELKPTSVADVAAMIALYRPGPMENIGKFIASKHGQVPITYPHEALKDILEETYGVIVYQDQVLLIAQEFGGYTLGEADVLRKAMGKKIPEVMAAERENFVSGAEKKGYSRSLAVTVFELIRPFAGYAFNKAHSACYAMIAYWTAYLKANYPVEYMVAILDAASDNPDRLAAAVHECRRLNIEVLGPDVNVSETGFSAEETAQGDAIRFGLAAIKNVGASAVAPIIAARESGGPYRSVEDFCKRAPFKGLNRRMLESLIKAGALESLGPRGPMLEVVDRILAIAQREAKLRESGQTTMFDMLGMEVETPAVDLGVASLDDVTERERSLWERELLGVEISVDAFTREMLDRSADFMVFANQISAEMAGRKVAVLGQVSSVRRLTTRKGDAFLAVAIALLDGEVEVVVWSDVLAVTGDLWVEGQFVTVAGTVRDRDGRVSVSAAEAQEYHLPGQEAGRPATDAATGDALATGAQSVGPSVISEPAPEAFFGSAAAKGGADSDGAAADGSASGGAEGPGGSARSEPATAGDSAHRNGAAQGAATSAPNGALVVRVSETDDATRDRYRLEDVVKTLLEYEGDEQVILEIETMGRVVKMDMPYVTVHSCPELTERLREMLGPGNVRVPS